MFKRFDLVGVAVGSMIIGGSVLRITTPFHGLGWGFVGAGVAVLGLLLLYDNVQRPAPRLLPAFDEPWFAFVVRQSAIRVYNASDVDAVRVRIEPIALEDHVITTDGQEPVIRAKGEHSFALRMGGKNIDLADEVHRAAVMRSMSSGEVGSSAWPMYADFEDVGGRKYRACWHLECDVATQRARLVPLSQFRSRF